MLCFQREEGIRGAKEARGLFFFEQKTAYEMLRGLVSSEMCIRGGRKTQRISAACSRGTPPLSPGSSHATEGGSTTSPGACPGTRPLYTSDAADE